MASKIRLSVAVGDYEIIRALKEGRSRGHVYEFVNLPSSFLVDFTCDAIGSPHYCHQQGMLRKPMTVQ